MPSTKPAPMPPRIPQNLIPPNLNYEHFEGADRFPFRPDAQTFEMINAWWLAEASLLSYAEPTFVQQQYARAGVTNVQAIAGPKTGTMCYVAERDDAIIVSFRGTEVIVLGDIVTGAAAAKWLDGMTDSVFGRVDSGLGGRVHQGFKAALDEIYPQLVAALRALKPDAASGRPIWMTGHSLGAALATLAADRYGDVQGLYTFGSPRVGDASFAADFHINTYRFQNNDDLVTQIPLELMQYVHVGQHKYFDAAGTVHDNPTMVAQLQANLQSRLSQLVNAAGRLRHGFSLPSLLPATQLPRSGLTDHTPLFYATLTWNGI